MNGCEKLSTRMTKLYNNYTRTTYEYKYEYEPSAASTYKCTINSRKKKSKRTTSAKFHVRFQARGCNPEAVSRKLIAPHYFSAKCYLANPLSRNEKRTCVSRRVEGLEKLDLPQINELKCRLVFVARRYVGKKLQVFHLFSVAQLKKSTTSPFFERALSPCFYCL